MNKDSFDLMSGVRVLDLSQFIPGPYATLLLSDLGADVLKIEPPQGDPQIADGPLDAEGVSHWYRIINRNKRIATVDLKTIEGRTILDKLIAAADVLLESFRPGVLQRLGYGPERLNELNGSLVHCALSGWGQTGPYRGRAGHDNNYQAAAGVLHVSGTLDEPVASNPPIADFAGALHAFGMISAALFRRARTGRGAYIDIAMSDAALSVMGPDIAALAAPDFDTSRGRGPYSGGWACYNHYRAACGKYVTIGALEPKFWANFCNVVGRPDWIERQHEPRPQFMLIEEVAALFATHCRAEWVAILRDAEACFHEVLELDEVASNEQVAARRVLRAGLDGTPDALLPSWVDGAAPPARQPYELADAAQVVVDWI
nr:CoA transferase [Mesorhizobium sp. WSM4875]